MMCYVRIEFSPVVEREMPITGKISPTLQMNHNLKETFKSEEQEEQEEPKFTDNHTHHQNLSRQNRSSVRIHHQISADRTEVL